MQEYSECQKALGYSRTSRAVVRTIAALGVVLLASSAAMTFGSAASILAGLALVAFSLMFFVGGQIGATYVKQAYKRFRESTPSYTFTNDRISATSQYAEFSADWAAVDRVIVTKTTYIFAIGNSFICVPKRDIAPENGGGFTELLRTHRLL